MHPLIRKIQKQNPSVEITDKTQKHLMDQFRSYTNKLISSRVKTIHITGLPETINPDSIKIKRIIHGEYHHTGKHLKLDLFENLEFMCYSKTERFIHIMADNSQILVCEY